MSEDSKVEPTRITLGVVFGWAFGIFFILGAAGMLFSAQFLAAGIAAVCAGICLPPAYNALARGGNVHLSGWVRALIVLVLLMLLGSQMKPTREGETNRSEVTQSASSAPQQPAVTPKVLLDIDGEGTKSTEKFTTQGDDWDLQYSFNCSNFGQSGNFQVYVKGGDGGFSSIPGVNELAMSGGDTDHYHTGGTFFLEVNSECTWHVKVVG